MNFDGSAIAVGIALVALVGWAWLWRSRTIANAALQSATAQAQGAQAELVLERESLKSSLVEAATFKGKVEALELNARTKQSEIDFLRESERQAKSAAESTSLTVREYETKFTLHDSSLAESRKEVKECLTQQALVREQLAQVEAKNAELSANLVHSARANDELKAFIGQAKEILSADFAKLASKAIDEKSLLLQRFLQTSTTQSKSDIDGLLKPLAERLTEFRLRVDAVYGEEAKERSALIGAVNELKTLNTEMAVQAAALTRALKGNAKVRGDWGELMLENVLKASGLEEGKHYDRQQSNTSDDGVRLQPDIVVRLPDDRRIVVDSKVNLIAWQEAMNAESPEIQQDALRRHAVALRNHVRELSEKNYPKSVGDSALDVTVAFVPIEGALSAALGFDDALQTSAFEKKVVFASPNTLMAILRVVERLWTRDKLQRQAFEISEIGGRILDALIKFLAEFELIGRKLEEASSTYSEAKRSLSDSPQSVIKRARRMVDLGVRGKRAVPVELITDGAEYLADDGSNIEGSTAALAGAQEVPNE